MAFLLGPCLALVLLLCHVSGLDPCPEACASSSAELPVKCSFNVTVKDSRALRRPVCCDDQRPWIRSVNQTFVDVSFSFPNSCNTTVVELDYPTLDTFSLTITDNRIRQLIINIKPENVKEINLAKNKLLLITKRTFNNFTNLRSLVLSQNEIINILEGSFNGLTKLESLDLSENNLTFLANVFTPLKNLQNLNLSRNHIEFIQENYFNNWLLQHLDLSHNNLKKVSPGALQLLPNLARLMLADNPRLGRAALDAQLLVGAGRRLQQLDASRTGLYQVPEAFTHSVRFLSLVGNRISSVRCGDLDSYPLLQSLDFSDNKIVSIEEDSLGRLEMLLFLNLNKNLITAVPKSLPDELKYLSLNNNLVNNLTINDFKDLPNLRVLLLQNNQVRYIEDHVFDGLLSLEMLDLSNNPIQALSSSTFDGPLSLRDLRLCYLNVSVPAQDGSFPMSAPESIQMLHLQASPSLARQLLADSAALAALSHLQYLDLRMNNLSEIRNDLLFYLGQLKTLRLYGNSFNCSAELWLKDWLNWNRSSAEGETCYYSTSEAKEEEAKYNCSFSETFTISDSLPPVNLYSTEMINKLLRYYGYLSNKTERVTYKRNGDGMKLNITEPRADKTRNIQDNNLLLPFNKNDYKKNLSRSDNKIYMGEYSSETVLAKARESAKILDQNRIQNDQFSVEHRFLDLETKIPSKDIRKGTDLSETRRHRSGKRLNTPNNGTRNESEVQAASGNVTDRPTDLKTVFSPYQSAPSYGQYVGAGGICVLMLMSIVLWASFRRRYRRRAPPEPSDQIEVSNISGGVLW